MEICREMHICVVSAARELLEAVPDAQYEERQLRTLFDCASVAPCTAHPDVWHTELTNAAENGWNSWDVMACIGEHIGSDGIARARCTSFDGEESVLFWDGQYLHMLPMHFFEEDDPEWFREPAEEEEFLDWLLDVKIDVLLARCRQQFETAVREETIRDNDNEDIAYAFDDWFRYEYADRQAVVTAMRAEFAVDWAEEQSWYITPPRDPAHQAAYEVWGRNWRTIAAMDADGMAGYMLNGD